MNANKTYRFRIINAGFALPFEIYIEKVIVHIIPNNISIIQQHDVPLKKLRIKRHHRYPL